MMQKTKPAITRQTETAGIGIPAEEPETADAAPPAPEEQADPEVCLEKQTAHDVGRKNPAQQKEGMSIGRTP